MPQAAAAPKAPPDETPEQRERREAEAAWNALVGRATAGTGSAAKQIQRAVELEKERADVMDRINSNRTYLRLMDKNEELDEDQAEFLDVFYPEKERGERRAKADIEATRKAREAARRDGSAA